MNTPVYLKLDLSIEYKICLKVSDRHNEHSCVFEIGLKYRIFKN